MSAQKERHSGVDGCFSVPVLSGGSKLTAGSLPDGFAALRPPLAIFPLAGFGEVPCQSSKLFFSLPSVRCATPPDTRERRSRIVDNHTCRPVKTESDSLGDLLGDFAGDGLTVYGERIPLGLE